MNEHDDRVRLRHMLDYAREAVALTQGSVPRGSGPGSATAIGFGAVDRDRRRSGNQDNTRDSIAVPAYSLAPDHRHAQPSDPRLRLRRLRYPLANDQEGPSRSHRRVRTSGRRRIANPIETVNYPSGRSCHRRLPPPYSRIAPLTHFTLYRPINAQNPFPLRRRMPDIPAH